jgi:hemolysin D
MISLPTPLRRFVPAANDELAFLPAALEIVETPPSPTGRSIGAAIIAFFVFALTWASLGSLDIIATAPGRIVPNGRTKIIQPLDSAVVRAIYVTDGQTVKAGDVLIELDSTISQADQQRAEEALLAAKLDQARLRDELAPSADDPFVAIAGPQDIIAAARARLESERRDEEAKVAKVDDEMVQKRSEQAEIDATIAKIDASLPLAQARADVRRQFLNTGFGNKIDYYQQQQQVVEMQHDRIVQQRKQDEAIAALATLGVERAQIEAEFKRVAYSDLAKADREAATATAELAKAERQTALRRLTAPVDGVVQDLSVHTVGGVVTPAQELMHIVPGEAPIQIEAKVANSDIGFVHAGQEADIKVETFSFTRYGLLHGKVLSVSRDAATPDASRNQRSDGAATVPQNASANMQAPTYLAYVALESTQMNIDGTMESLAPGMAVTVEIKTGSRRIISYLLSPLSRYAHDSLRER